MAARDGTPFVGTSGTANGLGLACVVSQARLSRKRLTHSRLNWNYVAKPDGLLRYAASRKEHDHGAIRRILRSTDFSDGSRHALDYARVIAPCYGATITLFHARAAPPVIAYSTGIPLMPSELITPDDRPEILAAAATTGSDLIVMGTHGRSGFERLVLGSVTEKDLRKASCPVLTVPPACQTCFDTLLPYPGASSVA
jgi:nucleotide-binding universal stress UspA family protein